MIHFRLLLLGMLLISVALQPRAANGATQHGTWTVLSPIPIPPVFYEPSALARGADGRVYLADDDSHTVYALSPAGELLAEWGSGAHLRNMVAIALDRDGALYVADRGGKRLVRFASTRHVAWSKYLGQGKDFFPQAVRLAAAPAGGGYALHPVNGPILDLVSPNGRTLISRRIVLRDDARYTGPIRSSGIHVGVDGTIRMLVSGAKGGGYKGSRPDFYDFVQAWSPAGRLLQQLYLGKALSKSEYVTAFAVAPSGDIVTASDERLSRFSPDGKLGIDVLSSDGKLLRQWSAPNKDHNLRYTGIAADGHGRVFVSVIGSSRASGSNRVLVFTNAGKLLAIWGDRQLKGPEGGLALDAGGNLYVAAMDLIVKFSPSGEVLARIQLNRYVTSIAVDRQENIYVGTETEVFKLSPTGQDITWWGRGGDAPGRLPSEFNNPYGMTMDEHGALYVADTANHRIQKKSPE